MTIFGHHEIRGDYLKYSKYKKVENKDGKAEDILHPHTKSKGRSDANKIEKKKF